MAEQDDWRLVEPQGASAPAVAASPSPSPELQPPAAPLRALVCDDMPASRQLLALCLPKCFPGIAVDTCVSARASVELCFAGGSASMTCRFTSSWSYSLAQRHQNSNPQFPNYVNNSGA